MQAILAVTVPFFALVLCGYLAARQQVLPTAAVPGLNAYVLYFALPCMLFRFGAGTPILDLLNPAVLAVYVAAALLVVGLALGLALALSRSRKKPMRMQDAAFGALVAAFPNSGFMGVPLLVALLGPAAAAPVICSLLADLFITSSLCIGLAHANGHGNAHGQGMKEQGAPAAVARALRGALSNPLPWAIALGAAASVTGLRLPGPLDAIVAMLAASATPVALFTIGAVLWRAGQHHAETPRSALLRDELPMALIKLCVHPLLVFTLGTAARALGAPLSAFALTVLTLAAALPSASNVSLLAERHGADNGRVARIIMVSTVLAFGSVSTLAWIMGLQPAR